jgi:gliding motility-associated-like protein
MMKPFTRLPILLLFFAFFFSPKTHAQLVPQIVGPDLVCLGECATYTATDLSPNCPPFGQWSLLTPNGTVINIPYTGGTNGSVVICWDQTINFTPGTYILLAQFDCAQGSDSMSITVLDFYQPDIISLTASLCGQDSLNTSAECQKVCANSTVTYTLSNASNPPGGPSAQWTVSGAESFEINGNFLTVTWGAAGTGFIGVFVNSICPGEGGICVEIVPDPDAAFTTQPPPNAGVVSICQGQTVYFANQSQGAESFGWFFDVLGVSTQLDPEFTFQAPGTYEVILVAANECGCSDTTSLLIQVEAAETPAIDCAGAVCAGEVVTYTTSANCTGFGWNVLGSANILGGGSPADNFITIEWLDGPVGYIELDVSSCASNYCAATMVEQIPVMNANAAIDGPQEVCQGEVALYAIPEYDGASYVWTVSSLGQILSGQGTNRIAVRWDGPLSAGLTEWVQVDYDNCFLECSGSAILPVGILNEFYTTGPIVVCEGETASYQAQNVYPFGGNAWNWEVQQTDGTVLWTSPSTLAIQSVDWTFGPGKFRLVATAADPSLYCRDSYVIVVDVRALPGAPAGIDGPGLICPGTPYTYSVNTGQPNSNFSWAINNGGSISTQGGPSVVVTWGPNSPYELEVTQTSPTGPQCPSPTVSLTVQALQALTLNTPSDVCVENTSVFSVNEAGTGAYQWTISPLDAGTALNGAGTAMVEILWHTAGPATVEVAVCGFTASAAVDIQPLPVPDPVFPAGICQGNTAQVSTLTAFATYQWLDENGVLISTDPMPQLGPGTYQLNATNASGCEGSASFTIGEYPIPEVYISTPDPTGYCTGHPPATLYATTTGSGYSYQWFYNGNPVGANATSLVDLGYGNYWVEATDVNGCTTVSNTLEIFLYCPPGGGSAGGGGGSPGGGGGIPPDCDPGTSVEFQVLPPTANCAEGVFQDISTDLVPGTLSWAFGDGTTSNDQGPAVNHFYSQAGFYNVVLTGISASTGDLCWDEHIVTIPAAADFYASPGCVDAAIQFEDRSTFLPTTSIASWDWDFGDGNASVQPSPAHTYTAAGVYNVTLTITAQSGCQSSITRQVEVYAPPVVNFDLPLVTCQGTPLSFEAIVPSNVVSLAWDFGDPASGAANGSSGSSTFHVFSATGSYDVQLTATSIYGCTDSISQSITIDINNLSGVVSSLPDPAQVCEGDTVLLTAPAGGVSWSWSGGQNTETIAALESGVYEVTLTDGLGCEYAPPPFEVDVVGGPNAVITAVEYNEYGQPVGIFYNAYSACAGEDVILQVEGSPGQTYVWSNGFTGPTAIFADWRGNPLPVGVHPFTVVVTDQSTGCSSTIGPFNVTVNELPAPFDIAASANPACAGQATAISVNSPDPALTYVWTTGQLGTSIQAVLPGLYNAVAINSSGCRREGNSPVTVEPGPYLGAIPSGCHTQCKPDTICIPDLPSVVSYQWYYNGAPVAAPQGTMADLPVTESGTYYVEMVDNLGCTATSDPLVLDLYDGYGTISGNVYMDLNQNGVIDGADTLVPGIGIGLWENGALVSPVVSSAGGAYSFPNILSTTYTVQLDTTSFPAGVNYLQSWQESADLVGCDDEEMIDWLLSPDCSTQDTVTLIGCENIPVIFDSIPIPPGYIVLFEYVNVLGCDSLIWVNVLHVKVDTLNITLETCTGGTVEYGGQDYAAGVYPFVYQGWLGCDSIVRLYVLEFPAPHDTLLFETCAANPIIYDGNTIPAGTELTIHYPLPNGCDSLLTIIVAEEVPDTTQVQWSVCEGGTIIFGADTLQAGDVMTYTFSASDGCDSLVTVAVFGLPAAETLLQESACEGSSVVIHGVQIPAGAQDTVFLQTYQGCDSLLIVTVQVLETDTTQVQLEVCPGETVLYLGVALEAGEMENFILQNAAGCDSVVQVMVTAFPAATWELVSAPACWNTPTGSLEISMLSGDGPFQYTLDGVAGGPVFGNLATGGYVIGISDGNGCTYQQTTAVTQIPPIEPLVQAEPWDCTASSARVFASFQTGQGTIIWPDGGKGSFWDAPAPGAYEVVFENECETLTRNFEVAFAGDELASPLYFPNIFSPNGDGINDAFRGYAAQGVDMREYELLVFDRWGNLLFETRSLEEGWDGRYDIRELDPGVYVYWVRAAVINCGQLRDFFKKGDVTLIR